ncbi:hypothetical protein TNCV_4610981 [Trichonephila clavipes]|nr:hypothetical protein TNCV_4610981 [Trichonephila clavipes]
MAEWLWHRLRNAAAPRFQLLRYWGFPTESLKHRNRCISNVKGKKKSLECNDFQKSIDRITTAIAESTRRWQYLEPPSLQYLPSAHGRKPLRSALGGDVRKTIGGNKLALPQSFDMSSSTKK